MKKFYLLAGLIATGLVTFTACEDNTVEKTIPEGIADVNFEEDKTTVTAENLTNWVQYSVQVANLLTKDASDLKSAWTDSYNGGEAYAEQFKNPGSGKTYASYNNCIQQIIEGCADIANEVGTAKIGDPRDLWERGYYKDAVYAVESWYSFHSIDDYTNNIRSIRNAVYGTRNGQEATQSVASYLKANNATLYNNLIVRINTAVNAIQGIKSPLRSYLGSNTVIAAQDACAALEKVLTNELKPIMMAASEEDLKPIIINYTDSVVLPTYADLLSTNTALNTSIRILANTATEYQAGVKTSADVNQAFKNAAANWMNAREPWETSEAFLFGPVADKGLDPNMDSWPLDVDALKNTLASGNFNNLSWEGEFDENDETIAAVQNVRGFHTLEFLLFYNGAPRTLSE
ncbi:MAG: imelysin family protein [Bacteroidaceae bacterium]